MKPTSARWLLCPWDIPTSCASVSARITMNMSACVKDYLARISPQHKQQLRNHRQLDRDAVVVVRLALHKPIK
ncbi:hypothetical protein BDR06DRAFT_962713 [Suillus hirtellus]|nr:hypothetical protein BDR06DRAFT_962713 [Suillus hirtellus]